MLEQKIDELTLAIKGLTSAVIEQTKKTDGIPYNPIGHLDIINPVLTTTVPAEEPTVEVVKPTKKVKAAKKKKKAAISTPTPEKVEALEAPAISLEDVTSEARKSVVANEGDDSTAVGIINKYQDGATLKTLGEEHYRAIYDELVVANTKGMEA
jgi:hypothetical protein